MNRIWKFLECLLCITDVNEKVHSCVKVSEAFVKGMNNA